MLQISAVRPGSVVLDLRLPDAGLIEGVDDIGADAAFRLIAGIQQISDGGGMPAGYDSGVLRSVERIAEVCSRGFESVTFNAKHGSRVLSGRLTPDARGKIAAMKEGPIEGSETVIGRLLMVDLKEYNDATHRCCIYPAEPAAAVLCTYDPSMSDQIIPLLKAHVEAIGKADKTKEGKIRRLHIEKLIPLAEVASSKTGVSQRGPSKFFAKRAIEQIAAEQGVKAIGSADDLAGDFWPPEESSTQFEDSVRRWRQEG